VPGLNVTDPNWPWKEYKNLLDLVNGQQAFQNRNLRDAFPELDHETPNYLGIFAQVMGQNAAYKTFIRKSVAQERQNAVMLSTARLGSTTNYGVAQSATALASLAQTVDTACEPYDGDVSKLLGFVLMLTELVKSPNLDFTDFNNQPSLRECIQ
jgi:hypothetical protein